MEKGEGKKDDREEYQSLKIENLTKLVVRGLVFESCPLLYVRRSHAPTGTARYQMPQGHDSCARIRRGIELT